MCLGAAEVTMSPPILPVLALFDMAIILVLMQYIVLLTMASVVFLWCWYQWRYRGALAVARSLPTGLAALPLLGHVHHFLFTTEGMSVAFVKFIIDSVSNYTGTICIWMGPWPTIFVQRAEDVKLVLVSSKTLEKGAEYDLQRFAGGNGLIAAPVHIWKITRRYLYPMFQLSSVKHLVPLFNETSRQVVTNLCSHIDGGYFDISDSIYDLNLRNAFGLIFGSEVTIDTNSERFKRSKNTLQKVGSILAKRFLQPWLRLDCVFNLVCYKEVQEVERFWTNLPSGLVKVIQESKKVRDETVVDEGAHKDSKSRPGSNFNTGGNDEEPTILPRVYEFLKRTYPQFTDDDMRFEGQTLLLEGSDTNSTTLCFCLIALASHPDIQEKVYNEIVSVIGDKADDITPEDANCLLYMDQVLKETMRRFTLVPFILRRTEGEIKLHDCTLSKGLTIAISIVGLHMSTTLYPDPYKFDPDRFSPENVAKRDKYTFIPFSAGPRDCIGKQYAMLSLKIALTHILRAYKVSTDTDISTMKLTYHIFLVSPDGYRVAIVERKSSTVSNIH